MSNLNDRNPTTTQRRGIFTDSPWQMSFGERAALEGVLSQVRPNLAIEIGTAEGGSLERIASHSDEVHSFDLVAPQLSVAEADHVTLHTGDSHELLRRELERFSDQGRCVDFVLVDGDHSSDGVKRDIEDLLASPAVASTAILVHDTTNPTVRAGLDAVHFAAWPKVAHVDLDFVPGYMFREERLKHELWGGLGLILVDSSRMAYGRAVLQDRYYPAGQLFLDIREMILTKESDSAEAESPGKSGTSAALEDRMTKHIVELEAEVLRITSVSAHHEALWRKMMASVSWKSTTPLRKLAAKLRAIRD